MGPPYSWRQLASRGRALTSRTSPSRVKSTRTGTPPLHE